MSEEPFNPNWFSKPGETLATLMVRYRLTVRRLAEMTDRDPNSIQGIITGTVAIDEELAAAFSKIVGGTTSFWLRRQATYEKSLARASAAVPKDEGAAWIRNLPLLEMAQFGWVSKPANKSEAVRVALSYFGVNSPSEWKERYTDFSMNVAFRTSTKLSTKVGALSAWLKKGELEANLVPCRPWDGRLLRSRILELRNFAKNKSPAYFIPRLRDICAAAGVAVVFIRAPSGCPVSGAARFISPEKAMVILSFRYLSDDHFWFTFFHEIGHLILHGSTSTFVDGDEIDSSEIEAEANAFAGDTLVPLERHEELMDLPSRTENVIRFAVSVGVTPGVIVGQLQHFGVIRHSQLNFLKRRFNWEEIERVRA